LTVVEPAGWSRHRRCRSESAEWRLGRRRDGHPTCVGEVWSAGWRRAAPGVLSHRSWGAGNNGAVTCPNAGSVEWLW